MRPWRLLASALLLLLVPLAACSAADFGLEQDIPEQRIPGSPLGGLLPSFLPSPVPLSIDVKQETDKRNTGPARHVWLTALTFAATPHDMPSGTFDFVQEIHIDVDAPSSPSLPKVEIAHLAPVPRGQTSISLDVDQGVDLLPYLNAGAEITATATGSQPSKDFTFDGKVDVEVTF